MSKEKSFYELKERDTEKENSNLMNTFEIDKPFLPIVFSEETKTTEILRRTKVLLNHTEDYNDFILRYYKKISNEKRSPKGIMMKSLPGI